ncbi:MAG: class I SAM-dependent methyltransferase [Chloroflexota bacterium]|nr:class I SAM-dependent methyltransferase [Chloroflexota bacterium]
MQVVDVATGTGNLAIAMAGRVGDTGKVTGIDLADGMLEYAERKARARKMKQVEFKKMDARQLSYDSNSLDVVTCGLAIFYFPDIPGTLSEMCRVLKPGGVVGISTADPETAFSPLSESYMARLRQVSEELAIHPPEYSETSALTRTKEGLEKLLKDAGFVDVQVREESIPVHFTAPEDWWNYGRGSTWGDLVLGDMPEERRQEFEKQHLEEVKTLFGTEGVQTATPVLFATGRKPGKPIKDNS